MLNELEQKVVDGLKDFRFGAYLQWAWFTYPDFEENITKGIYPDLTELEEAHKNMYRHMTAFNYYYCIKLPDEPVNPVKVEQEAWKLLMPRIEQHLKRFKNYIENYYNPEEVDRDQLLAHILNGWELLQDWNLISKSYKAKLERNWDFVEERENTTRQLIDRLKC